MPTVGYGICCMITEIHAKTRMTRTCIRRMIHEHGADQARERAEANCRDLAEMIRWCGEGPGRELDVRALRISSGILPHFTDPETPRYDKTEIIRLLGIAGDEARRLGIRLTIHPDQFNCIASNERVYANTSRELQYQAKVLDWLGFHRGAMVIHAGGPAGPSKDEFICRWVAG